MIPNKRYIIFLTLVLLLNRAGAQDITGTWEGDLGNDQFIQLNVIQYKNKLCGYTWDYVKADHKNHCKAYFTGEYDKKRKTWFIDGETFLENSGSHVLMHIRLKSAIIEGKNVLAGKANTGSGFETVVESMLESVFGRQRTPEITDEVVLRKTAERPQKILELMKDCYEQEQRAKDTSAKKKPVKINPPDTSRAIDRVIIRKPKDSIVIIEPPVITEPEHSQIEQQMLKRKNIEEGHVLLNTKHITLSVYDNAIVDGDTISIFFNGRLLMSHQRLTEKPIVINIELDDKRVSNELLLFAENLGSIPPNTALIVAYAGDQRYELFSKASLEENAVLVFEFQPK